MSAFHQKQTFRPGMSTVPWRAMLLFVVEVHQGLTEKLGYGTMRVPAEQHHDVVAHRFSGVMALD